MIYIYNVLRLGSWKSCTAWKTFECLCVWYMAALRIKGRLGIVKLDPTRCFALPYLGVRFHYSPPPPSPFSRQVPLKSHSVSYYSWMGVSGSLIFIESSSTDLKPLIRSHLPRRSDLLLNKWSRNEIYFTVCVKKCNHLSHMHACQQIKKL